MPHGTIGTCVVSVQRGWRSSFSFFRNGHFGRTTQRSSVYLKHESRTFPHSAIRPPSREKLLCDFNKISRAFPVGVRIFWKFHWVLHSAFSLQDAMDPMMTATNNVEQADLQDHDISDFQASQEPSSSEAHDMEIVFGNAADGSDSNSSSSSSDAETAADVPCSNRTIPEQREAIIRMHNENCSRRQISKAVGVSAKTVIRVLETSGIAQTPSKRGRRAVLSAKDEEGLLNFLLELDKVNLNWTWPLFHKLLEIISRKKDITNAKHNKLFSSKWLVGFSTRHKKKIALRVVDYGLSVPMQSRQKMHPGRMETFEQILKDLYTTLGIPVSTESLNEVQEMWSQHVESPKTRKVFAKKGRKNVRLTIGLPCLENGQKKRVRAKRPPGVPGQQTVVILGPASGIPYQPPPPVNDAALRLALNAFMIAGYSEEDGKRILRDLNVPVM